MDAPECPGCRDLSARLAQAEAKLLKLEAIIRDLQEKLKPPPDPRPVTPPPPAPAKKPTGRKPGTQPGHPPLMKQLVKPERVNHVVPYVPESCSKCRTALPQSAGATDPEPKRHQVAELPPMAAVITEHQAHARTCPCCGETTWATIPAEIRAHSVGPTLSGVVGRSAATVRKAADSRNASSQWCKRCVNRSVRCWDSSPTRSPLTGLGMPHRD